MSYDNIRMEIGSQNLFYGDIVPILDIDYIFLFFDDSVDDGTLEGDGPGNSASGRLNVLRNMLEMAGDLINIGDIEGACKQINSIIKKCDGLPKPPDFINGNTDTMGTLTGMLDDLTTSLECD